MKNFAKVEGNNAWGFVASTATSGYNKSKDVYNNQMGKG